MFTLIHITLGFSGSASYSNELINNLKLPKEGSVYVVDIGSNTTNELELECYDTYTRVKIPSVAPFNKILTLISLHCHIDKNVIVHINGDNQFGVLNINNNKHRFKFVYTCHFIPTKNEKEEMRDSRLDKVSKVIAVTDYGRRTLIEAGVKPENIALIYNGVKQYKLTASLEASRDKYGFCDDDIIILYVGRLDYRKGVGALINVFCEMAKNNKHIRLIIAGGGDLNSLVPNIKYNHSKVTLLGKLPREDIHELYNMCDIGVIPSLMEQCSYVALEMMSHGLSIIASDVEGMRELFVGKDISLSIAVNDNDGNITIDENSLRSCMERLVADKTLRKYLGDRAYWEWGQNYTADRMAAETADVYRSLI